MSAEDKTNDNIEIKREVTKKKEQHTMKKTETETAKKQTTSDDIDGGRKMTDEGKELAMKGDRDWQLTWFVEECLEFEAAPEGSDDKLSEAIDVIGCTLRFDISPADALESLSKIKKEYIIRKVVLLLSRIPDRIKHYETLNARQVKRNRKPFNLAAMERCFLQYKNQLK